MGCEKAIEYNCAAFYSSIKFWTPIIKEVLSGTKYYYVDPWSLKKFYGLGPGIIHPDGGAESVGGKWLSVYNIRDLSDVPEFGAHGKGDQGLEIEIP